jgi:hypothetical protein
MSTTVVNYNQSRVKMFRRCQKQYAFRYDYAKYYGGKSKQEMIPKRKRLPLYRGSWMHALQEALHHQWAGIDEWEQVFGEGKQSITINVTRWQDVHAALTEQFEQLFDEEKEELGDMPTDCERLFKSYLRFWDDDQERYSVAIDPMGRPMIELMVSAPLDKFGLENAAFKGRIDLVVEDDEYDGYWIWDAKWEKTLPNYEERMMSPQAPLYVWALRECYDLDVRGFVFNHARTKPPTVPRVLKRPEGMLSTATKMDTEYYTYLQAIKDNHGKHWKKYIPYYRDKLEQLQGRDARWFERQRIPVDDDKIVRAVTEYCATVVDVQNRHKLRDAVPRSYFFNCKFGCDYHGLCVTEFNGLEIEPLVKHDFEFVGERYGKEDLLDA